MPEYKLTYLNVKGLGEGIRFILSYMGKDFIDNRIEFQDWPAEKPNTPFGKVPVLEIDGVEYHQSTAILRYLSIEAGLNGSTPLENLKIDQVGGAITDIVPEIAKLRSLEGKALEDHKTAVVNQIMPFYFGKFEQLIKENNGYLANGKLSWADFLIVGFSDTVCVITGFTGLHEKYPNFAALYNKVQSLPGVKEWIQKRPHSI